MNHHTHRLLECVQSLESVVSGVCVCVCCWLGLMFQAINLPAFSHPLKQAFTTHHSSHTDPETLSPHINYTSHYRRTEGGRTGKREKEIVMKRDKKMERAQKQKK